MKKYLLVIILSVSVSALTSFGVVKYLNREKIENGQVPVTQINRVNLSNQSYPDFTFAAENCVKSVVHVKVISKGAPQVYSLFDFFFGNGLPDTGQRSQMSAGSGVIINPDGYIVTNSHVVSDADEISVTLADNKSYRARLIGADAVTDIAVIKIDASGLPFLEFGDSDSLRLGEWVIAIGNPYNLTSTVTAGIVSAKARSIPSEDGAFKIESFIQTDVAVNPGNSGGALVNTKGELIGINTAIASKTGSFTGYSFAVPASIAKKIVADFTDYGKVRRALLGVSMQDIDSQLAKEKGLKDTRGVFVADVSKGAAYKAGIRSSDVIVSINGKDVNSAPSVQEQISKYRPGDRVKVGIIRGGEQKIISVVLEGSSGNSLMSNGQDQELNVLFGATLQNASKESLRQLGLRHGVEVLSVRSGKFMDTGIKAGFIITYLNHVAVEDLESMKSIVRRSDRSILIQGIYPDGKAVYYGMGL